MNRVMISAANDAEVPLPLPQWSKNLKSYALKVLARMNRDKWDLSVLLCDDATISGLNARYRGKDEATDVLSFALDEGELFPAAAFCAQAAASRRYSARKQAGDIVISLDSLKENARRFQISEDEELRRLLIHGILHLDGMDHRTNDTTEPMLQLQEDILENITDAHILGRKV